MPLEVGLLIPEEVKGNAKVDPTKPLGSTTPIGNETDAERLAKANKIIEDREKVAAADKLKNQPTTPTKEPTTEEVVEPTDEEIQTKLTELEAKEEKDLSDDDKAYIEKYTQAPLDEITTVKNDLEGTYGIKIEGTYENNPDGLKAIVQAVAPQVGEKMLLDYFDKVPYMRSFYDHVVVEGKSLETFLTKNEKPAFEQIEIKPFDSLEEAEKPKAINNLKSIINMDLKAKGVSEEDINTLTSLYESNGTLFDKAKASKDSLKVVHKAQVDQKLAIENQRIAQEQVAQQAEYNLVKEMIIKNDINGTSIPVADVKAFQSAMLNPIDAQGRTIMDTKREELTLAQRTLLDYIVFKGFKVTGLTNKVVPRNFSFSKQNEQNNKREGNRLNGKGEGASTKIENGHPNFTGGINFNTLTNRT